MARGALVLALVGLTACLADDAVIAERESLGIFHMEAERKSSTCGDGQIEVGPTFDLDVKLVRVGDDLAWEVGNSRVMATVDENGQSFALVATYEVNVREAPAEGEEAPPPCVVRRVEELRGQLSDDERSFVGTASYKFEAAPGSECDDLLRETPPLLAELPCEARYDVNATRTVAP